MYRSSKLIFVHGLIKFHSFQNKLLLLCEFYMDRKVNLIHIIKLNHILHKKLILQLNLYFQKQFKLVKILNQLFIKLWYRFVQNLEVFLGQLMITEDLIKLQL
jgi:hypothetical protein